MLNFKMRTNKGIRKKVSDFFFFLWKIAKVLSQDF